MHVRELATRIGARICPGAGDPGPRVRTVHSANTMSGLIANASPGTLLVTSLNNTQLIRVAELMDAPGLCLVGAVEPSPELIAQARTSGVAIIVSPHGLEKTQALLEACLRGVGAARA
jgi:hypothetical protein